MKLLLNCLFVFLVLQSSNLYAGNVEDTGNGIYKQKASKWMFYIVDTVTEECVTAIWGGGATRIPCESLRKRDEWKPVITWINQEKLNKKVQPTQ